MHRVDPLIARTHSTEKLHPPAVTYDYKLETGNWELGTRNKYRTCVVSTSTELSYTRHYHAATNLDSCWFLLGALDVGSFLVSWMLGCLGLELEGEDEDENEDEDEDET